MKVWKNAPRIDRSLPSWSLWIIDTNEMGQRVALPFETENEPQPGETEDYDDGQTYCGSFKEQSDARAVLQSFGFNGSWDVDEPGVGPTFSVCYSNEAYPTLMGRIRFDPAK